MYMRNCSLGELGLLALSGVAGDNLPMATEPLLGTVGERIRIAREERCLTHRSLGERIGVSYALISRWERDAVFPRIDEAQRLCAALDMPISWLLEGIGALPLRNATGLPPGFRSR